MMGTVANFRFPSDEREEDCLDFLVAIVRMEVGERQADRHGETKTERATEGQTDRQRDM